jgi:hypothetical protein
MMSGTGTRAALLMGLHLGEPLLNALSTPFPYRPLPMPAQDDVFYIGRQCDAMIAEWNEGDAPQGVCIRIDESWLHVSEKEEIVALPHVRVVRHLV